MFKNLLQRLLDWLLSLLAKTKFFSERSDGTKRPNQCTYFAGAVVLSLLFGLLTGLAWERESAMRRPTDWIFNDSPTAFSTTSDRGKAIRNEADTLTKTLQGDWSPLPGPATVQLVNFRNVKDQDDKQEDKKESGNCVRQSVQLDKRPLAKSNKIKLAPSCISWSASDSTITDVDGLQAAEKDVLNRLRTYVNSQGKYLPAVNGSRDNKPQSSLAKAFGLQGEFGDKDSFDILTLVVCSKSGTVAVYPGTKEIGPSTLNPRDREWYRLAFEPDRASDLLSNGITQVFQDVRTLTPILVRSYVKRFNVKDEEFALAIELYREPEEPSEWWSQIQSDLKQAKWVVAGAFLVALLVFILLRKSCVATSSIFVFDLSCSKAEAGCRRFEIWDVYRETRTTWHLLWSDFEDISRKSLGTITAKYTSAALPTTSWEPPFKPERGVFSPQDIDSYERNLKSLLTNNVDSTKHHLEFPTSPREFKICVDDYRPPQWVVDILGLREEFVHRQGRAKISLKTGELAEIYEQGRPRVKSVVLLSYFQVMIDEKQDGFFLRGGPVDRLVSFPDGAELFVKDEEAGARYEMLLAASSAGSSRTLSRTNALNTSEGPGYEPAAKRPQNFAILDYPDNTRLLVVMESFHQEFQIDTDSGKHEVPSYRLDGYVSWRRADLEYHEDLFNRLSREDMPRKALVRPTNVDSLRALRLASVAASASIGKPSKL